MDGLTLDTGALIALERKEARMRRVIAEARAAHRVVSVPSVVLIEWWRDGPRQRDILAGLEMTPLDERTAKAAGAAVGAVQGATSVDAAVMAHAALRADIVWTSDPDDMQLLQRHFPGVRVLRVSGS
jgi:predicted nucleic acid-binding protein